MDWTLVLFFNMDVAAIAACVVWLCNFPNWRMQKRLSRRRFKLQALSEGEALVDDLLRQRLQKPTALQKDVISAFMALGMLDIRQHAVQRAPAANERCHLCPRDADRKVRQTCTVCDNHICTDHCTLSVQCDECL